MLGLMLRHDAMSGVRASDARKRRQSFMIMSDFQESHHSCKDSNQALRGIVGTRKVKEPKSGTASKICSE